MRRVIELATPHLAAHWPDRVEEVLLATGEAPEAEWLEAFREAQPRTRVAVFVRAAFGYAAEAGCPSAILRRRVRAGVQELLSRVLGHRCVFWAHNLGLGRNLPLAHELTVACHGARIPLLMHHHDWWFENRWQHLAELREPGFRTLRAVARAVFGASPWIVHVAINRADAAVLARHFPGRAGWLPNPAEPAARPSSTRAHAAREWLHEQLGDDGPVWLVPCRLLRRKNLAEALLLTRWLRPGAWLVTTGGVSSADEEAYADRLGAAARRHGWRLRLGVLANEGSGKPSVLELLAASEAVLMTSLQEGFGLAYLEATAASRPLIARRLPNIAPDLTRFGFKLPQSYDEVWAHPSLFNWCAERERQSGLFARWKGLLPRSVRRWAGQPAVLAAGRAPRPVPFSRLTLTAQLEVLAQPVEHSWERCAGLNPHLKTWRTRALAGRLDTCPWPRSAARWLGLRAYARRFLELVPRGPTRRAVRPGADRAAQAEFLREKLRADHLYPLLWALRT